MERVELEEVERFLKEKDQIKCNTINLQVLLPNKWELLGEVVSWEDFSNGFAQVSREKVRELVLSLKAKSSGLSLLAILIHVAALARHGIGLAIDLDHELFEDAARDIGLPAEEMPALWKGIGEYQQPFYFPSSLLFALAAAIANSSLEGLRLSCMWLSPQQLPTDGFQQLCSSLVSDEGDDGMKVMNATATSQAQNGSGRKCSLQVLAFEHNICLGNDNLDFLLRSSVTSSLRSLTLSDTGLDEEGAQILVQAAATSRLAKLNELVVEDNHIGDENLQVLSEALQQGQLAQLLVLKLQRNGITGAGIRSLASALQSPSCSLSTLSITDNRIGNSGIKHLMKALHSSKVEDLTLDNWSWTVDDEGDLTPALTLEDCDVSPAYTDLAEALQHPECKLARLSLDLTGRRGEIPQEFFQSLKTRAGLQSLCLRCSLTLGEQAKLGSCLKDSNIIVLYCVNFEHEDLFQGMLASKVRRLTINNTWEPRKVCDLIVGNPDCKLQSLDLWNFEDPWKLVLEALDRNYQSNLQELNFGTDPLDQALEAKRSQLLKRNSLFQAAKVSDQKAYHVASSQAAENFTCRDAYVAKLFLCGPSGAGKTTTKKNITHKRWLRLPASLQQHRSTSGIQTQTLSLDTSGRKLLICDLAGQFEFHAFHHSFLRGIDKSMFLIVLKVDQSTYAKASFKRDLVYWLRFIASHKSSSSSLKPRVFIALNFFNREKVSDVFCREAISLTEENVQHYQEMLDIEKSDIFQVEAVNVWSLWKLKRKLRMSMATLLSQQLRVPALCEAAKQMCMELKKSSSSRRQILQVNEEGGKLLAQHMRTETNNADKQDLIRFIFSFLNDMGEVVYFESHPKYAILDVEWFTHDVISLFIDPKKIKSSWSSQQQMEQGLRKVERILSDFCGGDDSKVEFLFRCLYEMGVVLPIDDGWAGTWKPLPQKVVVPALSGIERPYPPFERKQEEEYRYWGRRLECKDINFKLFPAGIFAKVQARVHQECRNPSFKVGNGWVAFKENRIGVYVRIGGDTDSWTDRQWVDIMVLALTDTSYLEEADKLMEKMKNCIAAVCLGELEIGEEKVLKSLYVKWRLHDKHGSVLDRSKWQLNSDVVAAPLSDIEKEAEENGLNYSHTWSFDEDDYLSDLLMPKEQRKYMEKTSARFIANLSDNIEIVKEVYVQDGQADLQRIPSFQNDDSKKLAKFIKQQLHPIHENTEDIKAKMEKLGRDVFAKCSRLLHFFPGSETPQHPYLTNEDNKFMKYIYLSQRVKIHYLCEWGDGKHQVDKAEGVLVELPREWLKKWSPVLIPSLILVFVAAEAVLTSVPGMVPLVRESQKGVMEFLKSNTGLERLDVEALKQMKPTTRDIEDVFKAVCNHGGAQAQTEKQIKWMMDKKFGLQWHTHKCAWLCEEHRQA